MDVVIKICWIALAAIHFSPAAVAFRPSLVKTLYGLEAGGPLAVLLTHRGVLFLAVMAVCICAALDPGARRAATLITAISVVGFLIIYARAGFPTGPLRSIAVVDAVAVLPLAIVIYDAWIRAKG
jgi:hypothetical protein